MVKKKGDRKEQNMNIHYDLVHLQGSNRFHCFLKQLYNVQNFRLLFFRKTIYV